MCIQYYEYCSLFGSLSLTHCVSTNLLGFISIRRHRNIDRGIGDLVIIMVPTDRTKSFINARLTRALLNSSH